MQHTFFTSRRALVQIALGLLAATILIFSFYPRVYAAAIPVTDGASVDILASTHGGAYTALNAIVLDDAGPVLAATNTFVLTAPAGFQFDPAAGADQAIGTGATTAQINLNAAGAGVAAAPVYSTATNANDTATWTVTAAATGGGPAIVTISGMTIRPIAGNNVIAGNGTANVVITSPVGGHTFAPDANVHPIDLVPAVLNNFLVGPMPVAVIAGVGLNVPILARDVFTNTLNDGVNLFVAPATMTVAGGGALLSPALTAAFVAGATTYFANFSGTATGVTLRATAGVATASNAFNIVQLPIDPNADFDRDSIPLSLDPNPNTPGNDFRDSSGNFGTAQGGSFSLTPNTFVAGVNGIGVNSTGAATFALCNLDVSLNGGLVFACGSLSVAQTSGTGTITVNADTTVALTTVATLTISDPAADGGVTITNATTSTGAARVVTTGTSVTTLAAGESTTVGVTPPVQEPEEQVVEPEEPVVEPEDPVVEPDPPVVEPEPNAFAEAASGGNFSAWLGGTIAIELALIGFEGQILNVWFWNGSIWLFYGPGLPDAVNSSFILVFGSVLWIVGA
ncbi:MAG: hypothetical protein DK306_001933 [Chloroflexi bacterium]|nr:MAG: hypothetical protein DK306_001933 [Chloroflexota bacterium]